MSILDMPSPHIFFKDGEPVKYSVRDEEIEGMEKVAYPTLNDMLCEFYKERETKSGFEDRKKELLARFGREMDRTEKRIAHIRDDLAKLEKNSRFGRFGEFILTNIYKIKSKDAILITEDFYEDPPCEIEIPLDPSLSASDNAGKYFEKFKKSQRGVPILKNRLEESLLKMDLISQNIEELTQAQDFADLEDFADLLNYQSGQVPKVQIASAPRKYSYKGYEIISGKNPAQNDEISLKISNKTDLWFHTRGIPGSHTIIRTKSGEKTPKEIILYAASIAAYYSKAKKSSKVPVSYTLAKNVSKKKGMPAGMVTIQNETTIVVNPQDYDFLEWLKRQEGDS
jgi:predicted ribosome quality control (RQC) complex YloA/Tae2 family protein